MNKAMLVGWLIKKRVATPEAMWAANKEFYGNYEDYIDDVKGLVLAGQVIPCKAYGILTRMEFVVLNISRGPDAKR